MIDFILTLLTPFLKWAANVRFPYSKKKVTGKIYLNLKDHLEIGTVLLSTTFGELTDLINPMKIKHGSMFVGNILGDGIDYVIEATAKGVALIDVITFFTTKDRVIGLNIFMFPEEKAMIGEIAKGLIGKPYDFYFDPSAKAFYCFEVAAFIVEQVKQIVLTKEKVGGKLVYSPLSFLQDRRFKIVFNTEEL
jgi:hypothetical protein